MPEGKPAILGGAAAFPETYHINKPVLPDVEALLPALTRAFKTRMVTNGENVREFEARAAHYLGADHAVAISSCSAGLMLAYKALALRQGEVILPSYTFTMSGNAILWNGHTPVFADCDRETWNIDIALMDQPWNRDTSGLSPEVRERLVRCRGWSEIMERFPAP